MAGTAAQISSTKASSFILGNVVVSQSFHLGFLTVRFYSLTLIAAVIAAFFIAKARAKKEGIGPKIFEDTFFWVLIIGFLSARAFYVILYFDKFRNNLWEIFAIWNGGLAIYGGIIGGLLTLYYICRKYTLGFWKMSDILVFALPIAQAIGRLGNYFNYEAFGKPTELPWKMLVPENFRPPGYENYMYFHPTFAYEIIWNLLVFLLLALSIKFNAKKPLNAGVLTGLYLLLYSIGRFFIESIRLDSAFVFGMRSNQIVALLLILLALGIIISRYVSQNRK